ncbi:MAG: hypothetical protein KDE47_07130 [Caldilineaceae bacterium]|nr:hypothetical protein [Caldilineaceae bacterium]MCB9156769.1 hypothetical protein [Caldilineaceae bacterium]
MSLFERISDQVHSIESRLNSLRKELEDAKVSDIAIDAARGEVDASAKAIKRSIGQLNLFYEILLQLDNDGLTLHAAIARALQYIWQKIPLSYAVLILGEAELGPYHYKEMHGIETAKEYLGKECPFPLSGVLAQTLLRKSDPAAPDYLCINDIRAQQSPAVEEFPWLPRHGSILILPLRLDNSSLAKGVLMLGRSVQDGFADAQMRREFQDMTKNLVHLISYAQIRHELTRQTEQLINVQLATREIAGAQSVNDVLRILTLKIGEMIRDVDVAVYLRSTEAIYDSHIDPHEPALYLCENNTYLHQRPLPAQLQQMFAWTMRVGEPVFYYPARLETEPEHPYYCASGSGMVVPIVGREYTFGVIQLLGRDEARVLDETDTLVMRSIANTVAIALKSVDLDAGKVQSQISSLQTLIALAEEQTGLFADHSQRVAHNASLIARRLGVDDKTWSQIRTAAALHNVSMLVSPAQERCKKAGECHDDWPRQIDRSSSLLRQIQFDAAIIQLIEAAARPFSIHEMFQAADIDSEADSDLDNLELDDLELDDLGIDDSELNNMTEDSHVLHSDSSFDNASFDNASLGHDAATEQAEYLAAAMNTHRNLGATNQLFVLPNASIIGAQIIRLADMFDTWACTTSRRPVHALETQLQYLNAHADITFEPHLIALFQTLLQEEQLLLPKRAQKQFTLSRV